MEKLTKENFWNALYEKYPGQVQQFCDWIDEYKKRVEWNILFANGELFRKVSGSTSIKYHDIPIAMQWGIFQQFCAENYPSGFGGIESVFEHPKDFEKIPELITQYFAEMKSNFDTERINAKYADLSNDMLMDNGYYE